MDHSFDDNPDDSGIFVAYSNGYDGVEWVLKHNKGWHPPAEDVIPDKIENYA